jgi:hypothetical protein
MGWTNLAEEIHGLFDEHGGDSVEEIEHELHRRHLHHLEKRRVKSKKQPWPCCQWCGGVLPEKRNTNRKWCQQSCEERNRKWRLENSLGKSITRMSVVTSAVHGSKGFGLDGG